jgi:hypothetical protein
MRNYLKVTVTELRFNHNGVGGGNWIESGNKETFRIEDTEIEYVAGWGRPRIFPSALDKFMRVVVGIYEAGRKDDLNERWREATRNMTADQMEEALKVLEGNDA